MADEATEDRKAAARLPKPRDVLLVPAFGDADKKRIRKSGPRSGEMEIFEQNWLWGQQWQAFNPEGRVVFELAFDAPLQTFEDALRAAAVTARSGKEIFLLTGHGVAQDGSRSESAFDTLPERGRMAKHKHVITGSVLDLPLIADRCNGRWIAKPGPDAKDKQILADSLAPRFDMLDRSGALFKQHGVRSFAVLSCNVGNDTAFQSSLAKVLRVTRTIRSNCLGKPTYSPLNPRNSLGIDGHSP